MNLFQLVYENPKESKLVTGMQKYLSIIACIKAAFFINVVNNEARIIAHIQIKHRSDR